MKIYVIRTLYPHWSKYSGYNRLLDFYSKKISFLEKAITMGENDFPKSESLKQYVKDHINDYVPKSYALNDFMAEIKLFLYWLVNRVDVVHYLDGEHGVGFFPAMANRVPFKKKPLIVATYHQPVEILSRLINQRILDSIDEIVVLCESQRSFLSAFVSKEKIHVIYHGVDNAYYHSIDKSNNVAKPLKCLSVGSWLRDYDSILSTAEHVKGENIEFHIINQSLDDDLGDNVFLHKNISDADLLQLYQECDVLFLPFKDATANNVVLEGMACGLPILSNNIESLKEYTGEGNPLLLDNDPELFAEKLIELKNTPELLSSLSVKSIARASELSWSNIATEFETLFTDKLSRKTG
ncbi:MAG: glycosyltransferase family 4 protein [Gammaproteobacteria bacterium]|nr:glycosyltransferase family 4 protein [Gammaproteobacteria bacterium]